MYCLNCGNEIDAQSQTCHKCGVQFTDYPIVKESDSRVGALGILFFLFPITGWIMYFVWQKGKTLKAKRAASVAWSGFLVGLFLNIISTLAETATM